MFFTNGCNDCNRYARLEMKNIDQELLPWLEDIIDENYARLERKEWKSKYNSYVVYDYEPFCTDGFEINLVISSNDSSFLNFIKYFLFSKKNLFPKIVKTLLGPLFLSEKIHSTYLFIFSIPPYYFSLYKI